MVAVFSIQTPLSRRQVAANRNMLSNEYKKQNILVINSIGIDKKGFCSFIPSFMIVATPEFVLIVSLFKFGTRVGYKAWDRLQLDQIDTDPVT